MHAVIAWHAPVPYDSPVTGEFDWSRDAAGVLSKTVENFLGERAALSVVQDVSRGPRTGADRRLTRRRPARRRLARARAASTGLLLGSVSQHVIAHAACPVVVAHDHRSGTGPIVAGVDGSPESEQALRWAAQQARLTRRELRAVNAWHVPVSYGVTVGVEHDWAADSHHALATAVTRALGEQDAAGVVREVVEDYPAAALLRAAEGADLLVVGCRGGGAFPGMRLGSVSRHVAAHASCPVLVHHGPSASPRRPEAPLSCSSAVTPEARRRCPARGRRT